MPGRIRRVVEAFRTGTREALTRRRLQTLASATVGLAAVALSFQTQFAVLVAVAAAIGFVRATRIPWRLLLGAAIALLALAAFAPALQVPGARDPLALASYTLAVLGCGAGLLEVFADRGAIGDQDPASGSSPTEEPLDDRTT